MHDSERLFIDLPAPPGGLQRLQRRLADSDRSSHWRRLQVPLGAALATSLLLLVILLPGAIAQQQQTQRLIGALHQAITPASTDIRVDRGAALELPSGNPEVRVYLVQSSALAPHARPD